VEYSNEIIAETGTDPYDLFRRWFDEACKAPQIQEPNAMCLSTATLGGRPSSRFLLMKSFSREGVKFFSNYHSRKGVELKENPQASVGFYWPPLHRQVRIEGTVSRLPDGESEDYFKTRPKPSQCAASISDQSRPLTSRNELEEKWKSYLVAHEDKDIPRPPHWGGYVLDPDYFEFWQGHSSRLHDRACFKKLDQSWEVQRLYP